MNKPAIQTSTSNPVTTTYVDIHQDIYRIAAGITALTLLLTQTGDSTPTLITGVLAVAIPLYILLGHTLIRTAKEKSKSALTLGLGYLDALFTGLIISYTNFPLLPGSALLLMATHNSLISGGIFRAIQHLLAIAAGAFALAFYTNTELGHLQTSAPISLKTLWCLTPLAVYFCFYGYYNRCKRLQNSHKLKDAEQQLLQLKLRAYKLSKYLSPALRKEILSGKEVKLETQRKKLTVFFSDIKGFSELAEELEPETLTGLLNSYLTEMSDIALKFGATVDKFMGDGIMVFFGDPSSRGAKTDCVACVSMAIAMKKHMKELQLRWQNQGIQRPLEIRMGINTGYCTVGNFGTENRLDYTLLGTEVNLASRLESAAIPGEILISHETYALVKDVIICEDKGEIKVKGYHQPVQVYSALEMRKNLGKDQTYFEHAADGFSVYMDIDKINNYDRERIIKSLKEAAVKLELQKETDSANS